MERAASGRPKAVDMWEHVTELEGKRVKCKHCGLVFAASANRIKSHINQIKGQGIRICTSFNKTVNNDLKYNLFDSQDETGISIDTPRDFDKLNGETLDCYMSPKTMWEGIMGHRQVQIEKETNHHKRIQAGPFLVSNMVNERDLHLIQYVFEYSCETYKVYSSSVSFLNQSEFTTLKPQTLLDSLVIDIFAEILTDIERKKKTTPLNWYLPVTFSNAALSGDVCSFVDFVERHNMRENYMSDLAYCEKMFIPVHIRKNSHGHFYLYIIHLKNQEIEIWDSLSDHQFISKKEYDETTQKLLLLLDVLFMDVIWSICGRFTKFQRRIVENHLLQPNEYDCGIFVVNFMQQSANYVKRESSFQFVSDEERLSLALKLLKSDLNKQRETLYDKAAERHCRQGGNGKDSDSLGIKRKHSDICRTFFEDAPTVSRNIASLEEAIGFKDLLPLIAEKLGGEGLIQELCNGFQLLIDKDKGVITLDSLRSNCALHGIDLKEDELVSMMKEGDVYGDGTWITQTEFCALMFRLSSYLMNESWFWFQENEQKVDYTTWTTINALTKVAVEVESKLKSKNNV